MVVAVAAVQDFLHGSYIWSDVGGGKRAPPTRKWLRRCSGRAERKQEQEQELELEQDDVQVRAHNLNVVIYSFLYVSRAVLCTRVRRTGEEHCPLVSLFCSSWVRRLWVRWARWARWALPPPAFSILQMRSYPHGGKRERSWVTPETERDLSETEEREVLDKTANCSRQQESDCVLAVVDSFRAS